LVMERPGGVVVYGKLGLALSQHTRFDVDLLWAGCWPRPRL
jgi:hypothetical protein